MTCGDWDLKTALPNHLKYAKLECKSYFKKWCNIKIIYGDAMQEKTKEIIDMLYSLNLKLKGIRHSEHDDSYNISNIVKT